MIKIFNLLILLFGLFSFASAQTVLVPEGVVYKPTSDVNNEKAKLILTEAISNNKPDSLFNGICYIGPILWRRYQKIDSLNVIKGGNIQFNVPIQNESNGITTTHKMSGKLIQTSNDFKKIWTQVFADLTGSLTFRKLSPSQLRYYWAVIFYDIQEPVFIVDNGTTKLLLQIVPRTYKILWIDEVY
ncbi:MAG: hypothetical protein NVV59_17805 [Chitinophagaceae bacterium]|nr:hypothetical protein [Chitinophagaceae bacterium]